MKTSIKANSNNCVTLKYSDSFTGEIVTAEITAPAQGGYVRVNGRQMCKKLRVMGSTLTWSGDTPLINLVRSEYRAMRRSESNPNF